MTALDELSNTSMEEIWEDPEETDDWEDEKQETEGDTREEHDPESE